MAKATDCIFLLPGQVFFGAAPRSVKTVLGSCVAVVLWHRSRRVGGMCHYMLPGQGQAGDARYAEAALSRLAQALAGCGARPAEFDCWLVGGGNMFPGIMSASRHDIGRDNAEAARRLARVHGFQVRGEHLGGLGHREVSLDLSDGRLRVCQAPVARLNTNLSGRTT
jgi:chemotaxis protein CheD